MVDAIVFLVGGDSDVIPSTLMNLVPRYEKRLLQIPTPRTV